MSTSTGSQTKRASSSRSRTATSTSETGSSVQSSSSLSATSIISLVPTNTPGQIPTLTDTLPLPSSSTTAAEAAESHGQKTSGGIIALAVVLGLVVLGLISAVTFLFLRKKRKQKSSEAHIFHRESKRRDNHPPFLPDNIAYFPSKSDSYLAGSPNHSLDSIPDVLAQGKSRSSRASSSIFVPDDNMTIASRSNFLRPVSLGEPAGSIMLKGMQATYGTPGQMPTLPESPNRPSMTMDRQQRHDEATSPRVTLVDFSSKEYDSKSTRSSHIFTLTRPDTPERSTPSPLLPPLPPVPAMRLSFVSGSKRDSNNTLTPSRYDIRSINERSRPQSLASVYSTRTQRRETADMSAGLEPDILTVLSRLKKRISTPWSINSAETHRADRLSITRASEEA